MSGTTRNISNKYLPAVCCALAVVTLAVFWQVNHFEFLNFDDDVYVTDNVHVQAGLTPQGALWAFTTTDAEFWHPLTWLSLMIDADLYDRNAGGYHLTNLILHVLAALLLFSLFHRMTDALWRSALVAALFAVHPLHVESVAWIAERKDVLSGFFWMLTLRLYVYYAEKPVIVRYLLVLFSFACGLMSKSIVITLPVAMVLLDYWPLKRLREQSASRREERDGKAAIPGPVKHRRASKEEKRQRVVPTAVPSQQANRFLWLIPVWQIKEKAPFFLLSLAFSLLTLYTQDALSVETWPFWSRLANAFVSYITYLIHFFYPLNLAVFYPFVPDLPVWKVGLGVALFFLISAAVWFSSRRFPQLLVGWFWYVIALAPVIGFIQVGKHAWADRYSYLSTIGITIMLAWGIPLLFKSKATWEKILLPAGLVFVALMAGLTWRQCGFWQNNITLYERALNVTDNNALAHYNLAATLVDVGRTEEAKPHFREAIRLRPHHDDARVNLGAALAAEGKYEEAIALYREAIGVNPYNEVTFSNLGSAYSDMGRNAEAAGHYLKAIELNPDYAHAHFNYANLLMRQGMADQAEVHYRRTIDLNGDHAEARHALADVLAGRNQSAEAVVHYLAVVKVKPSDFRALNNLGVNLDKQARYGEAIEYYRRALSIQPDDAGVHFNLAVVLIRMGGIEAARAHLYRALDLKPDFASARQAIKSLQKMEQHR